MLKRSRPSINPWWTPEVISDLGWAVCNAIQYISLGLVAEIVREPLEGVEEISVAREGTSLSESKAILPSMNTASALVYCS